MFARLERAIEKAFVVIDDPERRPESANGHTANISIGTLSVGSGSVAIGGVGDVTSSSVSGPNSSASSASGRQSSARTDQPPSSTPSAGQGRQTWWENVWLVAIIGGALAAIIAGLVLYFLLN